MCFTLHTTDDQEDVAMMINKYGLIALPIVDHEMCMVGIVTVDDAMLVMQEETTEDISIMAGMSPSEETYFGTSVVEHVKSRLPWLLFLMLSATVTQMIMNSYESALVVMPQLAGFIPMLTGTGWKLRFTEFYVGYSWIVCRRNRISGFIQSYI